MKKWQCVVCGLIYDEAKGWPEEGIEAGTRWEDVPEDWLCPDCGQRPSRSYPWDLGPVIDCPKSQG